MDRKICAYLLTLVLVGCPITQVKPPVKVDTTTGCADQCKVFEQLSCPEAQPTPNGVFCAEACSTMMAQGTWTEADMQCVLSADSVESLRVCKVRCKK